MKFSNKSVLIVGFGSIGKRHFKNILLLGFKNIYIISKHLEKSIKKPTVKVFRNYIELKNQKIDYCLICSSSSDHYHDFLNTISLGIKSIFVEKPISNNLNNANKMLELSFKNNVRTYVGFDMRFDPGLLKVKNLIEQKVIGDICTFRCEVGQYLPDWRSNIDYSKSSSAKLGGGVMLDLIHEFDFVSWILGDFKSIYGKNNKSSNLNINTEDNSLNIITLKNNVIGTITLDYLQKKLSRTFKVIGKNGIIIWKYTENSVKWIKNDEDDYSFYNYADFSRNDRFKEIIKSFFNCSSSIKYSDERLTKIENSISSLEAVHFAKISNLKDKPINL